MHPAWRQDPTHTASGSSPADSRATEEAMTGHTVAPYSEGCFDEGVLGRTSSEYYVGYA